MKIAMHDPLEFEVLGSSLGVTVDPVISDDGTVYAGDIAFGGSDSRRVVVTLSRSGQVAETRWTRPGLIVERPHR